MLKKSIKRIRNNQNVNYKKWLGISAILLIIVSPLLVSSLVRKSHASGDATERQLPGSHTWSQTFPSTSGQYGNSDITVKITANKNVLYDPGRSLLGNLNIPNPMLTSRVDFTASSPTCDKLDGQVLVIKKGTSWIVGPAWFDGDFNDVTGDLSYVWDGRPYSDYTGAYYYFIWFYKDASCGPADGSYGYASGPLFNYTGSAY